MKLLIAGVFSPESTNTPMAWAIESLGANVRRFPYRDIGRQHGPQGLAAAFYREANRADAAVVCKGFGGTAPAIDPAVIKAVNTQTVYWLPDSTDVQGLFASEMAMACDIACATSLVSCGAIAGWGHKHVNQIFEGYNPRVFRPRKGETTRNVTFAGSLDAHRMNMLDALEAVGIDVDRPMAYLDDLSRIYAKSWLVLNFTRGEIFSDRVVQAMASGTCLLSENCRDLEAAFETGRDLAVFDDWHDLPPTAKRLLDDAAARNAIAQAAPKAVERFTWNKQMAKLLQAMNGEEIRDGAFGG